MADATMEWGDDEFYEERMILDMHGRGMSVSAIAAKLGMSIDDVIVTLERARAYNKP